MSKPSRVLVLTEDQHQQRLVRKYLERLGYEGGEVSCEDLPSGRGCGEQWVRARYSKWVRAFRKRSSSAQTALVVVIDADVLDVRRRFDQLRDALNEAGMSPRSDTEAVVHLVPKRNIETWVLCLSGRDVDEITDYTREPNISRLIPGAALTCFHWTRPNQTPPEHCTPSLHSAIPEARRLERPA